MMVEGLPIVEVMIESEQVIPVLLQTDRLGAYPYAGI